MGFFFSPITYYFIPHFSSPSEDNRVNMLSLIYLILIVLNRRLKPHNWNHHEKEQILASWHQRLMGWYWKPALPAQMTGMDEIYNCPDNSDGICQLCFNSISHENRCWIWQKEKKKKKKDLEWSPEINYKYNVGCHAISGSFLHS